MNKDEAMKLALEALENHEGNYKLDKDGATRSNVAITALQKALAEQPAQTATYTCGVCGVSMQMEQLSQQEPVAWANRKDLQNFDMKVRTSGGPLHTVPLYTSPPQRPWVGLTHEEHMEIMTGTMTTSSRMVAVEAALRSKNT